MLNISAAPQALQREEKTMKYLRLWVALGIFGLLAAVGSVALTHAEDAGNPAFSSGSYLTTITDSNGNFASRGVMTLHADQTIAITDSAQGGTTFFFSSQLGSWKPEGKSAIVARTIDFNYPPSPGVARLDYTLNLSRDNSQITGTATLRTYPLEAGNPLDSEGTLIGTFTLVGELIKP